MRYLKEKKIGRSFILIALLSVFLLSLPFSMADEIEEVPSYELSEEWKALVANDFEPPAIPTTSDDFAQVFLYMGKNHMFEYSVNLINARYDVVNSSDYAKRIRDGFWIARGKYPEYMSFASQFKYRISSAGIGSKVTFTFENKDYDNDEILLMQTLFEMRVKGYLQELVDEGKISNASSDYDKARAIYEWIIFNTDYDYDYQTVSHTGFGLTDNKTAVCEGYTATFNLMCRLADVDVQGVIGNAADSGEKDNHIWSMLKLNGELVHVDATWGDPAGDNLPADSITYKYFARSSEKMRMSHEWNKDLYGE